MKLRLPKSYQIILLIILSYGAIYNYIFAYDETIVHPTLTEEAAKLYNFNFSEKLTEEEIGWIRQGSIDEDEIWGGIKIIRSSNHFYNPFDIKEWKDYNLDDKISASFSSGIGNGTKQWAHDSVAQSQYIGGDYTWERAIYDYVNGDRKRAYESLGHILHLIEDMAVPAHTRNDFHLSPKELEAYQNWMVIKNIVDYEPYESWTGNEAKSGNLKFNFADSLQQENKKPIIFGNINEYFDNVAGYSNNNFFSKDTIYVYTVPNNKITREADKLVDGKILRYIYGDDEYGQEYKLADFVYQQNSVSQKLEKKYIVSNDTPEIHFDYWSRLAPKSILAGAGIINLFKTEAEKAKKNPASIQKPPTVITYYVTDPVNKKADEIKSSAIAFYDWGKAAAVAAYDAAKSVAVAAYDAVKTTTVTVFNMTKTGLQLAQEYVFASANSAVAKIGDFFNSSADSIFSYLTPTTKAQLEFDISKPLPAVYLLEDIISQAKAAENAEAAIVAALIYDAELSAVKNQKSVFSSGEEIVLSAEIKNTGAEIWQGEKISLNIYLVKSDIVGILPQAELFNGVNIARDFAKQFYHSSWLTAVRPASLGKAQIESGAIGVFNFIVTAPLAAGDYFFRARPVWQSGSNEFEWIGDDIASWNIRVEAPPVEVAEKSADAPIENIEQSYEAEKQEEEILAEENDLPQEDDVGAIDENIEKEKLEKEALAAAQAARLEEEAARLAEEEATRLKEEEDAARRRRARAWVSIPPETTVFEFPENPTLETTASFKFSSTKANSTFLCSLDDSEFVSCGEYAIFENLAFGEYILKVKAEDEYGNIDETPAEYSWAIEKAESAPHLVISEIQAGTNENGAEDEFVELYNPTDQEIDLAGWELRKKNSSGKEDNLVDNADFTGSIAPKSFFLIAHKNYKGSALTDLRYSAGNNLSYENNSVIIYNGDYQTGTAVDEIIYSEIPKGQSLERKAQQDGVCISAQAKGEFLGNGCDTDDLSDYEIRLAPNPQNSASIAEPAPTPAHNITNGLDYPSIQLAIDNANQGDEIQADSGTYYENVIINKQLILKGVDTGGGKPVVDAKGSGSAIILSADNIALEGFSAINTANAIGGWPIAGILVKSQKNIIKNNTVNSNNNGIVLYYSNNNELTGNEAFNNGNGIYLDYSNDNNLSNNATNSNNNGIVIVSGGNNNLSDNTANSNDRGIYLLYAGDNFITDNSAESNSYGIFLQNSQKNILTNNKASSNNAGIFLEYDSNYNIIASNGISLNSYGLYFYYAGYNTIYHNNIVNNTNQAFDCNKNSNAWNNNYPSGGNYWSDYGGIDLNSGANQDVIGSDGIGDAPHIIIGYGDKVLVQDRYPLMQ